MKGSDGFAQMCLEYTAFSKGGLRRLIELGTQSSTYRLGSKMN